MVIVSKCGHLILIRMTWDLECYTVPERRAGDSDRYEMNSTQLVIVPSGKGNVRGTR